MGEKSSSYRRGGQGGGEKRSCCFSLLGLLGLGKGRRLGGGDDTWDEAPVKLRGLRHGDEDTDSCFAEPDIDKKATVYIARFYGSLFSNADLQTKAG